MALDVCNTCFSSHKCLHTCPRGYAGTPVAHTSRMKIVMDLQVLSVMHCLLDDLNWLAALPALRELYAAYNCIASLEALMDGDALEVLDLEGNSLAALDQLEFLGAPTGLRHLALAHNPVASHAGFLQAVLLNSSTTLTSLDGVRVGQRDDDCAAVTSTGASACEVSRVVLSLQQVPALNFDCGISQGAEAAASVVGASHNHSSRPGTAARRGSNASSTFHHARCAHVHGLLPCRTCCA